MANWIDTTSYSRNDKKREPTTWNYRNDFISIYVVRGHRFNPDEWVFHCRELNINTQSLGLSKTVNIETAQQLALNIIRNKLNDIVKSLK